MQIPVSQDGTMEFIHSGHTFPHFEKISVYDRQPSLFICSVDTARTAVTNFEAFNHLALSYFINVDVTTNDPAHSILAGDRLLQVEGRPIKPGLFICDTNRNPSWTPGQHRGFGDLAFADGHVELSRSNLAAILQRQPGATNRFSIP